jgi:hypothetical protein
MSLSKDSTIKEVFEFIKNPEVDVQVQTIAISDNLDTCAQYMVLIQGKQKTARVIMANLMATIQEMHDLAEKTVEGVPSDESKIILH